MDIKTHSKKIKILIIVLVSVIIAIAAVFYTKNTASKEINGPKTVVSYTAGNENSTVFEELLNYGKKNNIDIKYNNNFKYGVMIDSIGSLNNGDEGKYWQYYVNGQLGDVAADKKTVSGNDVVEWRFEKVPF